MKILEMWQGTKSMEALSVFWKYITAPHTATLMMKNYMRENEECINKLNLKVEGRNG